MAQLKTWGEQLAEIQTAISNVLVSQHYEINGRVQTRADLDALRKREQFLVEKLEQDGDVIAGSSVVRGAMNVSFS